MSVIQPNLSTFIEWVKHSLHGMVKFPNSLKISLNVRYLVCMLASNRVYARTCKNPKPDKGYFVQRNHRDKPSMLKFTFFSFSTAIPLSAGLRSRCLHGSHRS